MSLQRRLVIGLWIACAGLALLTCALLWIGRSDPVLLTGRMGTSFTLVDDHGQPITEKALAGHPSLLYFGFTRCPEVCPTTLYEMAGWFKSLGAEGKDLKAFFFSVDPGRDSPELMHNYTSAFTDRITGITGRPDEMQRVIKSWHIYAARVPTEDGDYTMDHTASVFLVDATGDLKGTIAYGEDTQVAMTKIRRLLKGQ